MALERELRRLALAESTSAIAEVTAATEHGYDCQTTDGRTLSALQSENRTQWTAGAWVTIERCGPSWRIVGLAPYRAG